MGDTTQETAQQTQAKTKQAPWTPTIPTLTNIIGQIQGQAKNTAVTGNENSALDTLTANAKGGNIYAGNISNLANDLFAGGVDRTGAVQSNYDEYKAALTPTATAESNPWNNPAFAKAIGYLSDDITNRVKGEYAGAGRDPSGAGSYGLNLGEGIARGVAPTWLNAYNDMEARKLGAIDAIHTGGNTATGILSGLDQLRLGNQQAGIGVGQQALQAKDAGANQLLSVEAQRRNLPLGNIGNLSSLITPLAQLGGTAKSNSTTTGSAVTSPPLGMQIVQGLAMLKGGNAGWGGGNVGASAGASGGK